MDSSQAHSYRRKGGAILGKPYRAAFFLWRRSPRWFRTIISRSTVAKRLKTASRNSLAKFAARDDLYSREYYTYIDTESSRSAPAIAESILSHFAPRRVIDVGCGTGALIAEFRAKGVTVVGLEYSRAALDVCRQRGLDVYCFNIEDERHDNLGEFDAAICFEVAEHISERYADPLVDLLVAIAPCVIFSAAVPGQGGGVDHVNEQPNEYWVAKFEGRGYPLQYDLTQKWRALWERENVAGFYSRNVMIFQRTNSTLDPAQRAGLV